MGEIKNYYHDIISVLDDDHDTSDYPEWNEELEESFSEVINVDN